jgi:hypothetical protein
MIVLFRGNTGLTVISSQIYHCSNYQLENSHKQTSQADVDSW